MNTFVNIVLILIVRRWCQGGTLMVKKTSPNALLIVSLQPLLTAICRFQILQATGKHWQKLFLACWSLTGSFGYLTKLQLAKEQLAIHRMTRSLDGCVLWLGRALRVKHVSRLDEYYIG